MAIPHDWGGEWPTLREFVNIAVANYDTKDDVLAGSVTGPRGTFSPRYLTRVHNGETLRVALPGVADSAVMAPHIVRNLCDRLEIPRKAFRFLLTEDGIQRLNS